MKNFQNIQCFSTSITFMDTEMKNYVYIIHMNYFKIYYVFLLKDIKVLSGGRI